MTTDYINEEWLRETLNDPPNRDNTSEYWAGRADRLAESPIQAAISRSTIITAMAEGSVQGSMTQNYYHGCRDCSHFSLSFVGAPYVITEEDAENSDWSKSQTLTLYTEEEYEKLKTLFVTHFNKHHREITKNREKDTRKYNIVPKKGTPTASIISYNHPCSSDYTISEISLVTDPTIGSIIPEYEVITDPLTGQARAVRERTRD